MHSNDNRDTERQPTPQTPAGELARAIAARRADAAFQARLRESLERHRDVLERLAR